MPVKDIHKLNVFSLNSSLIDFPVFSAAILPQTGVSLIHLPRKLDYTTFHDNRIECVRVLHICVKSLEIRHQTKALFKYLTKQLKFQFAEPT